jgi:hypothetical protein
LQTEVIRENILETAFPVLVCSFLGLWARGISSEKGMGIQAAFPNLLLIKKVYTPEGNEGMF